MKRLLAVMIAFLAIHAAAARADENQTQPVPPAVQAPEGASWQARVNAEKSKVLAGSATGEQSESGVPYGRVLEGLGYCLAVLLIGFHIFKKFHGRMNGLSQRNLRLLETLQLSPKSYLHLVEIDRQKYLIGNGQQSISIQKLDDGSSFKIDDLEQFAQTTQEKVSQEKIC